VKVLMPYSDAVERMGGLPAGLEADVWDGTGELPDVSDVELYVPPYSFAEHATEAMGQMPSLRVVQTLTAGVDHIRPYVPDGVVLCNAKGVHDASTAELALALILAAQRGIPDFVRAQAAEEWRHGDWPALADCTVLIVGYGSVGAAVERRLAGFEVDLLRVARRSREGVAGWDALPDLLPAADVVVLTVPLTEETRGLVDAGFLGRMRAGALLVNVSRGVVVRTEDLLAELVTGRLRAALDVTEPEPLPAGHPLWQAPGLLLSPHVGGNTSAFLPRAFRLLAEQLRRFAGGDPLLNVVQGAY